MSRDPIGYSASDVNVYCFVANGPTQHPDPFGLAICRNKQLRLETGRTRHIQPQNIAIEPETIGKRYSTHLVVGGGVGTYAGTSGFVIGKTLKAKYKGEPDCCCDFSESKIGFQAFFTVVDNQRGGPHGYQVPGTNYFIPEPADTYAHERWHTDAPTINYELHEQRSGVDLVRRLGLTPAGQRAAFLARACVTAATHGRSPRSEAECQRILETCVNRIFYSAETMAWIVDHGAWHVKGSHLKIWDNTPPKAELDPKKKYDELSPYFKR